MSWECSGKEFVSHIERLGRSEMVSMSQCGFVLSDGHVRIAIDTVVSDLFYSGSDRSRRLVSPPFPVDAMPSLDAALVTHGHAAIIWIRRCLSIRPVWDAAS